MNECKPHISVIIPLYNKAPYIKRALDSVLSQPITNIEIIVIGGRSNDGGEKIVETYKDSRISLIKENGKGVSSARNQGVKHAKSDLIAFLDADDEWLPNYLELIIDMANKYPDAGIYGTGFKEELNCGLIIDKTYHPELGTRKLKSYFTAKMDFCNHRAGQLIATSGTVVSKDAFENVGGFPVEYIQSEDRCLRGKIALEYDVIYNPTIGVIYHNNTQNNTAHISSYLKDPFSEYISSLPSYILKHRSDYRDIIDFNEANQLYMISRNLLDSPKSKKEIRKDIRKINLSHNKLIKYQYTLYSYLPNKILWIIFNITNSKKYLKIRIDIINLYNRISDLNIERHK